MIYLILFLLIAISVDAAPITDTKTKLACYDKMNSAMKAMNMVVQGNSGFLIYKEPAYPEHNPMIFAPDDQTKQQWDATIKACVR